MSANVAYSGEGLSELSAHFKMYFEDPRYCKLNKTLLSVLGLWPYDRHSIRNIFVECVMLSCAISQLGLFLTHEIDVDLMLRISMCSMIGIAYIIKYTTFIVQRDTIRKCTDTMRSKWAELKRTEERRILETHLYGIRQATVTFSCVNFLNVFGLMFAFCAPDVLDILVPLNESRSKFTLITLEHFVFNPTTEYYLTSVHANLMATVGATTVVATETAFALYVENACALFHVACHRLETVTDKRTKRFSVSQQVILTSSRLIDAVHIYKEAIKFADDIYNCLSAHYYVLISCGVLSLSFTMYQFADSVASPEKFEKTVLLTLLLILHFVYFFLVNYVGQRLLNYSGQVFSCLYIIDWYSLPLFTQKLLLMFMQRAIKCSAFGFRGLYTTSVEGFSSLCNLSLSYFMVIHSTHSKGS